MKHTLLFTVVFALAACTSSEKVSISTSDPLEDVSQETRCGATIEADSGTLLVPNIGQDIVPGSICIFTIHLQSTNTFRLNITDLDVTIPGRDETCSEAAVRIYSLTNLVPSDSGENYTFCNDSPAPPGSFYLSGNLLTVIYQASQNASLNSGFTLNFEGIGFQHIPVTHESSYTSATSGLIRYPVEGEYEPNRVTTWLIKTSDANPNLELEVASGGQCQDRLHVYVIEEPETKVPHLNHIFRYTPTEGICQLTDLSPGTSFVKAYGIIQILATDQQGRGNGFELPIKSLSLP